MFCVLLVAEVLQGIGPEKVAHGPECGGLFEAVELKDHKDDICIINLLLMLKYLYKRQSELFMPSCELEFSMATHLSNIV